MKREQQDSVSALCAVYYLTSSSDGEMRYIGQTQRSLSRRLASHLNTANNTDCPSYVYRWIRSELKQGHVINIIMLEDDAALDDREIYWIAHYRSLGTRLTNTSNGGVSGIFGMKRSEQTKALMRGPKSMSTRMKMMKPKSSETKRKMAEAQAGNAKSKGEANRHAVLTEQDVKRIKTLLADGAGGSALAHEYGLQKAAISKIKTGRTWRHVNI